MLKKIWQPYEFYSAYFSVCYGSQNLVAMGVKYYVVIEHCAHPCRVMSACQYMATVRVIAEFNDLNTTARLIDISKSSEFSTYSCRSFLLQIQRSQVRFPALPDFLRSSGSGTGSSLPRVDNWGAIWRQKYRLRSRKPRLTTVRIRCADHATPSIRKSWHQLRQKGAVACSV
jgi:hypothetical protein